MDLGDFAMDLNFEELEDLYSGAFGMVDAFDDGSTQPGQQSDFDTTGELRGLNFNEIEVDAAESGIEGEGLGSFDSQGIQATTVAALLNQFENTSVVASSRDGIQFYDVTDNCTEQRLPSFSSGSIQFHNVTEDSPPHQTQSLPASRVCSASASPANTPPSTPPPDVLHKIRSNHSQASKRKATIMLPYAAPPAKRGRGKAVATPQVNGCSSKLQRILSRNNSAAPACGVGQSPTVQFAGSHPAQVEELNLDGAQLTQPKVATVSQNTGKKGQVSTSPAASCAPPDLRMHRVTDPAVAQSILSKTPRALSLLAGPVGSETSTSVVQPKVCLVQNGPALSTGNVVQLFDLKNSSSGFVSLLTSSASDSHVAVVPQNNVRSAKQSTCALKGASSQPQAHGVVQPVNTTEDEPSRKCNIVLSRGAENIRGDGLQSVLDHDYCRDSLRRVIVDEFDLDISPTRSCLQKVQSMPIIKADLSGKLQVSNNNVKGVQIGSVSCAAEINSATARQSATAQAVAVTLAPFQASLKTGAKADAVVALSVPSTSGVSLTASSSAGVSVSSVKKKPVVASTAVANPAPTLTAIKQKPDTVTTSVVSSAAPLPMALVSVLSKMPNLESLFTLENGTLKLHPSVTASLGSDILPQENPQLSTSPVSTPAVGAEQKPGTPHQNSSAPAVSQHVQHAKQSGLVPSASVPLEQNGLRKPPQQPSAPAGCAQIVKPLISSSSISKPPALVDKMLKNQKDAFYTSDLSPSRSANTSSVTVSNSNSPSKQGALCLSTFTSNSKMNASNTTLMQKQKSSPQQYKAGSQNLTPQQGTRELCSREDSGLCADTKSRDSRDGTDQSKTLHCSRHVENNPLQTEASQAIAFSKAVIKKDISDEMHQTDELRCAKTEDDQQPQALYSMPSFEMEGSFEADLSERVVPPVTSHPHSEPSPATQSEPLPILSPSFVQTGNETAPPHIPPHSPGRDLENNPHHSSPHGDSPEAGTSHETMYHYSDDFSQAWEEQAQLLAERNKANHDSKTVKYSDEPPTAASAGTTSRGCRESAGRGKRGRKSDRSRGAKSWKPGRSPVKNEEGSEYFSKIPSYYTALSIPIKTGRKQLTAEAAESTAFDDSLPADSSPARQTEDTEWYSKLPPYFSCFTNSTKYDQDPAAVKISSMDNQSGRPADTASAKKGKSPKTGSAGSSNQSKTSSPARSPERGRWSRGSSRSHKRRRSNSSSGSSRSGSRRRSWKPRKRRCRRSPSVSGSYHSSSGSHSRSSSRSRSRSRSSCSRSRSRSRSRRRYRSRSPDSHYNSGSRGRNDVSTNRYMRKQLRKEDKIKKMEERKIVYVGRIPEDYTRRKLYERFERFGKIEDVSVHFRETGDNYGFVTYYDSVDAFRAIDKGNSFGEREFELCFGGRRHFCANEYADLDGNRVIEEEYTPVSSKDTMDFDALLRQAQRKLKKTS